MINKMMCDSMYIGRLNKGEDLLGALTAVCRDKQIRLGKLEAIGAVQKAVIGYFDQNAGKYNTLRFDEAMEIVSLMANISVKDGQPFLHAHIALAGADGACVGGHLMEGTPVFACEFIVHIYSGAYLERIYDKETTLSLWR